MQLPVIGIPMPARAEARVCFVDDPERTMELSTIPQERIGGLAARRPGDLFTIFTILGGDNYDGEPVTLGQHAWLAACIALREGHDIYGILAALFHDLGHFYGGVNPEKPFRHQEIGASELRRLGFPEAVWQPVLLHVAAKRYLVATDSSYGDALSEPSRISLAHQGGPMSLEEQVAFKQEPYWMKACELRRIDDRAKDPTQLLPNWSVGNFAPQVAEALGIDLIRMR